LTIDLKKWSKPAICRPPFLYGTTAQASARLFFDAAPIDPTARRIIEALNATPQGLTRSQIRELFHRHLSRERIGLALEQLSSLGLIDRHTEPGRGRHSTLWTGVDAQAINTEPDEGA
jgi:hypothetical protein